MFQSPLTPLANHTFYLVNGIDQRNATVAYEGSQYYSFDSYEKSETDFQDIGFYQCGVIVNGRTILSERADVWFPGILI